MDDLIEKIKEYSHLAATLSNQAVNAPRENRKYRLDLMRQARDASKQCQALIQELKKQEAA